MHIVRNCVTVARLLVRTIDDIRQRLRAEYLEMPGLQLKADQVQRLCGIEATMCQILLDELVASTFLCRRADGRYARLSDGKFPTASPVKAPLAANPHATKTA
jgi:hypothetical protein